MNRLREYRINQETRDKYAEVFISVNDFIYPYFVVDGNKFKREISSLRNVFHFSIDELIRDIEEISKLGITKILLFGVIEKSLKTDTGSAAYSNSNLISRAVQAIKKEFPEITIITDVCLCGYTNHGHCGILNGENIDNDATLPYLAKMALQHAQAGADFVAPSAMMDGQVSVIKQILSQNKLDTKILGYSAKYASGFYGPFRDAVNSAPSFGDRKTYQMDNRNISQAIDEVQTDIDEGADWVMVKPAHTYLDIIQRIRLNFPNFPLTAYQVSGEYMMIKAAAEAGYMNEEIAMQEVLTAIKRAGANYIISYYAMEFVKKRL
jgi:porphobilinogen synthase